MPRGSSHPQKQSRSAASWERHLTAGFIAIAYGAAVLILIVGGCLWGCAGQPEPANAPREVLRVSPAYAGAGACHSRPLSVQYLPVRTPRALPVGWVPGGESLTAMCYEPEWRQPSERWIDGRWQHPPGWGWVEEVAQ